jgi:hypothetical protein
LTFFSPTGICPVFLPIFCCCCVSAGIQADLMAEVDLALDAQILLDSQVWSEKYDATWVPQLSSRIHFAFIFSLVFFRTGRLHVNHCSAQFFSFPLNFGMSYFLSVLLLFVFSLIVLFIFLPVIHSCFLSVCVSPAHGPTLAGFSSSSLPPPPSRCPCGARNC